MAPSLTATLQLPKHSIPQEISKIKMQMLCTETIKTMGNNLHNCFLLWHTRTYNMFHLTTLKTSSGQSWTQKFTYCSTAALDCTYWTFFRICQYHLWCFRPKYVIYSCMNDPYNILSLCTLPAQNVRQQCDPTCQSSLHWSPLPVAPQQSWPALPHWTELTFGAAPVLITNSNIKVKN